MTIKKEDGTGFFLASCGQRYELPLSACVKADVVHWKTEHAISALVAWADGLRMDV